jgi:hypothetical protein
VVRFETFVFVKRPVTADGVITRVTPLPEEVLMPAFRSPQVTGPLPPVTSHTPPVAEVPVVPKLPLLLSIVHATGAYDALKLPLLCARALLETQNKHSATTPIFAESFLRIMSSDSVH